MRLALHGVSTTVLIAAFVLAGGLLMPTAPAQAGPTLEATNKANSALDACNRRGQQGKALQTCVADVLDRLANDLAAIKERAPQETTGAVRAAAAGIRAALTKEEALAALTRLREFVAVAMQKAKQARAKVHPYEFIQGTVSRAAKLIQAKG